MGRRVILNVKHLNRCWVLELFCFKVVSAQWQNVHLQKHESKTFCKLTYFLAIVAISGSFAARQQNELPASKMGKVSEREAAQPLV